MKEEPLWMGREGKPTTVFRTHWVGHTPWVFQSSEAGRWVSRSRVLQSSPDWRDVIIPGTKHWDWVKSPTRSVFSWDKEMRTKAWLGKEEWKLPGWKEGNVESVGRWQPGDAMVQGGSHDYYHNHLQDSLPRNKSLFRMSPHFPTPPRLICSSIP